MIVITTAGSTWLSEASASGITPSVYAKLTDAANYTPTVDQAALTGNTVFETQLSKLVAINPNTLAFKVTLDTSTPSVTYGEIGLFNTANLLIAVATLSAPTSNLKDGVVQPIDLDFYLQMTSNVWSSYFFQTDQNGVKPTSYSSIDALPKAPTANQSICLVPHPMFDQFLGQSVLCSSQEGAWTISDYSPSALAFLANYSSTQLTLTLSSGEMPTLRHAGSVLVQVTSGNSIGAIRTVQSVTKTGSNYNLYLTTPFFDTLQANEQLTVYVSNRTTPKLLNLLNNLNKIMEDGTDLAAFFQSLADAQIPKVSTDNDNLVTIGSDGGFSVTPASIKTVYNFVDLENNPV